MEHKSPKSRYLRTSRKNFEKELGCIERRQARIRRIRQKIDNSRKIQNVLKHEKGPEELDCAYHIGKTQDYPLDLRVFTQEKFHDPAAKVYYIALEITL